jgi:solute carrier family 25 phosphate transporter 23/24/25/41
VFGPSAGTLSRDEVAVALAKVRLPCTQEVLDLLFERADSNADGRIDFSEFMHYVCAREDELFALFNTLDKNRDGRLVAEELAAALDKLHLRATNSQIKKLVRHMSRHHVDVDHGQDLAFDEFRDFLLLLPLNSLRNVFDTWAKSASLDLGDSATIPDEIEGGKPAYLVNFIAGGVAGAISRTLTAPMDRLKVLMQASQLRTSILQGLVKIYTEGGVYSFWKGNGTNVIKIIPESSTKFVSYEFFKNQIARDSKDIEVSERFLAGAGAGLVAQTLIYPLEIAKTRLAISGKDEYSGIMHCLNRTVRREGLRSLYRGLGASLLGIAPYAGIDLALFMTMRDKWIQNHPAAVNGPGPLVLLAMGAISSTCGATFAYPLQLIRTRLQAQGMNAHMPVQYEGVLDCARKTVQRDGLRGLYRGLGPNLLKTLPAISISYVVYERTRRLLT